MNNTTLYGGYDIIQPASEGPLLDFFFQFRLGFRDAITYKRFLYRYFKQETGVAFRKAREDIYEASYPSWGIALRRLLYHELRYYRKLRHSTSIGDAQDKVPYPAGLFRRVTNPDESVILAHVKHPLIKDYLCKLFKKAYVSQEKMVKLQDLLMIERLVNLEVLSRSIHL